MYLLRRWWTRHGLRIGLVCLALTIAWAVRQTQGAFVFEIYQRLSSPFHGAPSADDVIADARLQELQARLIELESQNRRLQELVDYVSTNSQAEITAPIIGRSADHWWQQITIGRGSQDGIENGAVVLGTGGVVGRVIHVTPSTSRVLLISDPSSQVGVTVARSRSMGYLRGQAENRAVMEFFDKVPDVRVGDVVTTSSFSQLFPAGLPVGRIESINLNKSPAPEAVIELTAPISYLEWVIVAPNPKAAEAAETIAPIPTPSGDRPSPFTTP